MQNQGTETASPSLPVVERFRYLEAENSFLPLARSATSWRETLLEGAREFGIGYRGVLSADGACAFLAVLADAEQAAHGSRWGRRDEPGEGALHVYMIRGSDVAYRLVDANHPAYQDLAAAAKDPLLAKESRRVAQGLLDDGVQADQTLQDAHSALRM